MNLQSDLWEKKVHEADFEPERLEFENLQLWRLKISKDHETKSTPPSLETAN